MESPEPQAPCIMQVKEEPQEVVESPEVVEPEEQSPELLREQLTDSAVSVVLNEAQVLPKKKKSTPPKKGVRKKIFSDPSRCDICGKVLVDREGLRRHLRVHTGERPFPCRQCARRFASAGARCKHEATVHARERRVLCAHCPAAFTTERYLKSHMPVHTGEKPFACTLCDKRYARSEVLRMHMYTHTGEKPFACSVCDYACRDHSTMRRHEQRHAGTLRTYQCRICLKKCSAKWRLKLHVAAAHLQADVDRYQCHHCGKRFRMRALIVRHLQNVHMRLREWACEVCGRRFTSLGNMRTHAASHSTLRPHACPHCGMTFKTQGVMSKHAKLHSVARLACGKCGRAFHRPAHLRRHERTHRPRLKLTPCPHCHVCFYNQRYVDKHVRTVHDKNRTMYECDHCGYEVKNKPAMVSHLRRHGGKKKYACEVCGKRFRRATGMKVHCRLQHGFICTTRFHKSRAKKTVPIKEEPLDIEENALPQPIDDEDGEAAAAREIRSYAANIQRVPERYFDDHYILREGEPLKVKVEFAPIERADAAPAVVEVGARPRVTVGYSVKRPPVAAGGAPPEPPPLPPPPPPPPPRLRRSAPPVNYRELANPTIEEAPPPPPRPPARKRKPDEPSAESAPAKRGRARGASAARGAGRGRGRGSGGAAGAWGRGGAGGARRTRRPARFVSKCPVKLDVRQCYTCFKLFPTDEALTLHCREHYPTDPLLTHNGVAETENHENPSPSIRSLNREKSKDIDRANRTRRLYSVLKRKLVRRGGEWQVESEPVPVVLTRLDGDAGEARPVEERMRSANEGKEDLRQDMYLDRMIALSRKAKALGKTVLFPCDKCPRVCRLLCALRMHRRLHDTHARPYRAKRWLNRRVKSQPHPPPPPLPPPPPPPPTREERERRERERTGKPKPILPKNYRCDESLKRFFEENITGTDVDFEHFLREYRKVERKRELAETNAWGVETETAPAEPSEGTAKVRRGKNRVTVIRRRLMRRRMEMRDELRRKLAARGESVGETVPGENVDVEPGRPPTDLTGEITKL